VWSCPEGVKKGFMLTGSARMENMSLLSLNEVDIVGMYVGKEKARQLDDRLRQQSVRGMMAHNNTQD
jgi:hypothetical protein